MSIIYNKSIYLVLRARQIEHILINVNTSLGRTMLEHVIKCDESLDRGQRVLKTPL